MAWKVLSCGVFAIFLSIVVEAEPVVSSPQEDKAQLSPDPRPVLYNTIGQTSREGTLLQLRDYVKQGDAIVKERVNDMYSNLNEQLKQGDKLLKERIEEGLTHEKEERKEGDDRLKEELDEDVDWLKAKLAKGRRRVEMELAEGEARTNEEIAELREAFERLPDSVKQGTLPDGAVMEDLKQQMSDFRAELNTTQNQLQTTQDQLQTTQDQLQTTQDQLQTTQDQLQTTQDQLQTTQEKVQTTQGQLQTTQDQLQTTQHQLQTAQEEISLLKASDIENKERINSTQSDLRNAQGEIGSLKASDAGSSFIRWGHAACPGNTSLVYSGVAGGTRHIDTGGGSNYLCLGMTPEVDPTSPPAGRHSKLGGAEYEVSGRGSRDVVCSVCRAPQSTTLMIPATWTCPAGWTTQYRGHLMTEDPGSKGRTEHVCVDKAKQYRPGGQKSVSAIELFYTLSVCGTLPCPPFVGGTVVTCVVCSV
ncbi:uncharacterized protein LOC143288522 [Babylonia areolata]|uniref:uncharacterized protein LOC143288522 n=1 Tax=Babylonia areolata TaxID=304850 RepID=UPI003FD52738